jgi:hypothetical protein
VTFSTMPTSFGPSSRVFYSHAFNSSMYLLVVRLTLRSSAVRLQTAFIWHYLTVIYSIGKELGVDPEVILQTSHGRRTIDVLKLISPEKANWECKSCYLFSPALRCETAKFAVHVILVFKLSALRLSNIPIAQSYCIIQASRMEKFSFSKVLKLGVWW